MTKQQTITNQKIFDKLLELAEILPEKERAFANIVTMVVGQYGHEIEDLCWFSNELLYNSICRTIEGYKK
jgi:hypothetical protein